MNKMLSVKIPKKNYSVNYVNILTDIVKESLASFCEQSDFYFCDKIIDFVRSYNGGYHKIEWTANDEPLLLSELQIKEIKKRLREVPYNSTILVDHNSRDEHSKKHTTVNKRWTTKNVCPPLDGMYVTLDSQLDKSVIDVYSLKLCDCIERHQGEYTYHIPESLSIIDLLKNNKYINLFASAIVSYKENLDLSILKYTVDIINNNDFVFDFSNLNHKKNLSMMDSLQYRLYLSSIGRRSLIIQDFDGRYIVIYKGEEVEFDFDGGKESIVEFKDCKDGKSDDDILLGWRGGNGTLSLFDNR